MKLNPFGLIEDLINEHGSSNILKERLLLLKEELSKVEKDRSDLIAEVAQLKKELSELRKQYDKETISKEFTEYMGALYKRDVDGRYLPMAFCPECKRPLVGTPDPGIFPYSCSGCGSVSYTHLTLPTNREV